MKNDAITILASCPDEELMRAYADGDMPAFEQLYDRHAGRVFGYIKRRIKDETEQKDLLQEVFLRLHKFRNHYVHSLPFLPWLFTITRSVLIDRLRKTVRRAEELHAPSEPAFETGAPAALLQPVHGHPLAESLQTLSVKERQILTFRYSEDLQFDEIARRLGISSGAAVRQSASRAIRKLRKILGVKGG